MYNNLLAEMARKNISKKDIAETIDKNYNTTREKILGKSPLTYLEATLIKDKYFSDLDIEYIFKED